MDLRIAAQKIHAAGAEDSHNNLLRRSQHMQTYEDTEPEDTPPAPERTFPLTEEALKEFAEAIWDEGYTAGEADERRSADCAKRGGPVSDCDCQVPTPNPYEED